MKLKVFVGPKGSGKDECAKFLKANSKIVGKIPFAGPMKRICAVMLGIPLEHIEDRQIKERDFGGNPFLLTAYEIDKFLKSMNEYVPVNREQEHEFYRFLGTPLTSIRHMLQFIGTEIIRNGIDPNWHCKAAFSLKHLHEIIQDFNTFSNIDRFTENVWAVTDCRFVNEYLYLKHNHDCEFFYVERPSAEEELSRATHQSELEIVEVRKRLESKGALIIKNDSDLSNLRKQLMVIA